MTALTQQVLVGRHRCLGYRAFLSLLGIKIHQIAQEVGHRSLAAGLRGD